ncbi:MAG TPA: hypothetical protein VK892_07405 [Pyrinomonadaceae bacterium]|nr:hypothetical protein [Pyrinomonadaceae bacterium]
MTHILEFEKLVRYDSGKSGISINVQVRSGQDSTTFEAKIDTGSTYCIFERIHGEKLGIEIESGLRESISTASGSFWAFAHQITLVFEDYEFDSTVYFAQDENFNRNVLGRHGWLDRVIIGINDYDGKLYLSRYES